MADPNDSSLPTRIGEFDVVRHLGTGGSGVVYEANWGPRRVALKILRSDLLVTEAETHRFYSEAKILSELGHAGIVKILSYGRFDDGRPYLAMELLEGQPLAALVSTGALPLSSALFYFSQVAGAVAAIHERGLIHRDLKPENILIANRRFAVLLDFGIAKGIDAPASTTTQEGGVRGTPAYMAPERFFGQPASVASDVYEIGVLLFVMITSQLPWDSGLDPEARLNPKRPRDRGVEIPTALETVIMKALSTRPEARYASVAELADEVAHAGASVVGPPASRTTAALPSGPTPIVSGLGVAPTESAVGQPAGLPSSAPVPSRRGFRLALGIAVAGLATALVIAIAIAASRSDGAGPAKTLASAESETVQADARAAEPTSSVATEAAATPTRTGDDSGLATAPNHHPKDTTVLIGLRVREIRQSAAFAEVINREKVRDPIASVIRALEPCGIDLIDDIDWVSIGISSATADEIDAIVSGNFSRDGVEDCVSRAGSSLGAGTSVKRSGAVSVLGDSAGVAAVIWLSNSSFMFSTRKAANAEWLEARRKGTESANHGSLREALAGFDATGSLWLVGRAEKLNVGKEVEGVPVPELIRLSIKVSDELAVNARLDYQDEKAAVAGHAKIDSLMTDVRKDPLMSGLLESADASLSASAVSVALKIGKSGTTLISSAIVRAIKDTSK